MKHIIPIVLALVLFSCMEEVRIPQAASGSSNTADFFINNNSSQDIEVTYVTSSLLGLREVENAITIPANSTKKIFDADFVQEIPVPSKSFSKITFYLASNNANPALVNRPIKDEMWVILDQNLDELGYGFTSYQFSVSDEELN